MILLLTATAAALFGICVLRYWEHPASALGVFPFLIGLVVAGYALDKVFENQRYMFIGYCCTLLVAIIAVLIYKGRHAYRARRYNQIED